MRTASRLFRGLAGSIRAENGDLRVAGFRARSPSYNRFPAVDLFPEPLPTVLHDIQGGSRNDSTRKSTQRQVLSGWIDRISVEPVTVLARIARS
jgi:hypothetical protein